MVIYFSFVFVTLPIQEIVNPATHPVTLQHGSPSAPFNNLSHTDR